MPIVSGLGSASSVESQDADLRVDGQEASLARPRADGDQPSVRPDDGSPSSGLMTDHVTVKSAHSDLSIKEDQVLSLQQAIRSNTYQVSSQDVAKAMLSKIAAGAPELEQVHQALSTSVG